MTDLTSPTIDANRPWIQDSRDDPARMSWLATLLNPLGYSSKLHFSRAWTGIFMARLLSFVIPLGAIAVMGMAGANAGPVMQFGFIPFALIFVFTLFQSLCIHIRRLSDGKRPAVLAALVFVPLIMFFLTFSAIAYPQIGSEGVQSFFAAQKAASEAKDTEDDAVAVQPVIDPAEAKKQAEAARERQMKNQQIMSQSMSMAALAWFLSAIGVAVFSLTYVARIPNGGEGRFSTGSTVYEDDTLRDYEMG